MASAFKQGGQPYKLNEHFKSGKSITHDEAVAIGIGRLAQRMQDIKKRYMELVGKHPIMVISERNERGGTHARYFYRGCGSPLENDENAREY